MATDMYENKPRQIDPYAEWAKNNDYSGFFDYNKANAEIAAQTAQQEPQPIYQDAVDNTATKYNDFNSQIVDGRDSRQPTPPVTPPATPQDILNDITSPLPEPKYDQARQDRVQMLAKVNALGKGLSALGDVFALSRGGLVNQRQNDGRIDRLQAMYQGYEDDYNRRMDQHNRDKINLYLQQLREGRADARYEDEKKWRQQEADYRKGRDEKEWEWKQTEAARRIQERTEDKEESKRRWEEEKEMQRNSPYVSHNLRMEEINARNKNAVELAEKKAKIKGNGDFELYDGEGNTVHLINKSERSALLGRILNDPATKEMANNDIALMKATFGDGLNNTSIDNIVAQYWDKSPEAIKWLEGRSSYKSSQSTPQGTGEVSQDVVDAVMSRNAPQLNPAQQQQTQGNPFNF